MHLVAHHQGGEHQRRSPAYHRRGALIVGLLAAASSLGAGRGTSAPAEATSAVPQCIVPAKFTRLDVQLREIGRRLAARDPVVIVALGSSSTAGAGASSTAASYPSRLAAELAQRFPTQPITVQNRGVGGELAIDMLSRFDLSVAVEHPHLVLWQLGTNAVLRGHERWPSDSLIRGSIRRMKALDADVVLIDPQFAPKVIVKPDVEGMIDLIAAAATQEHVGLFHRFALMRHWHEVDGMPFATFVSADGLHMNDWSYSCLAKAIAAAIGDAAS